MEIRKPFAKILKDIRKKLGKSQKNSRENSKLKKKTQNSRKKLNVSEDCPSPDLPSGVKKKPALMKPVGHSRNYAQLWVLGFLDGIPSYVGVWVT